MGGVSRGIYNLRLMGKRRDIMVSHLVVGEVVS